MPQAIHFISIGGSTMHNLAIALQQQGYIITGSDENFYDPSQSRLQQHNLLPTEIGWFPERIHSDLKAVIVGMHAGKDNPELIKALNLGLPIYSYPEFVYQQSQQKQRIVIAGSHGKTTITAMILHALNFHNRTFDYWIGEPIDGFDTTVRLTSDINNYAAPIIIIEGDEYASSPIDSRPKFLHYKPHIALISGIAWDHVNTYPTWDEYVDQFESLAEAMPKAGVLIFDESDDMLDVIGQKERADITKIPYMIHPNEIMDGQTHLITKQGRRIPVQIFGDHNMKNIAGAMAVCDRIGITDDQFYESISSFKGVAQRLEQIVEQEERVFYHDSAYSPAKVEAATEAVKQQHPNKRLLTILELYPFSVQNRTFLEQYKGTLDKADEAVIFINANNLTDILEENLISLKDLTTAFGKPNIQTFTDIDILQKYLNQKSNVPEAILLMGSRIRQNLNLNSTNL